MVREQHEMASNLVLLPGLDGTGNLFADFVAFLPRSLSVTIVRYPTDRFLSCNEAIQFVDSNVPESGPFVILAESFSTPIALKYAATRPPNLAGVVLCAGFISKPIGFWSSLAKLLNRPWLFNLGLPRILLKHFLLGRTVSPELIQELRHALESVDPEILSNRVRGVLDCDAVSDLAQTIAPLLYVRALRDRLLSASCHEEILRIRPEVKLVTIDAPHMVVQREPEKVARIVVGFIANSCQPSV